MQQDERTRDRFEPIAWSHGWKVLDWKRGQCVPRLWETERHAKRYAARRNRVERQATAPRYVIGPGGKWILAGSGR